MKSRHLAAEMRAAAANIGAADRRLLHNLGIPLPALDIFEMVGIETVRIERGLYQPDPGGLRAYITPALVDFPDTPETSAPEVFSCLGNLVDLVAWDPRTPQRWALRVGAATWLGCIPPQYIEPAPVHVWRSPLAWLQNGLHGFVVLSRERAEIYRLLSICSGGLLAEDIAHVRELRGVLARPWPAPRVWVAGDEMRHAA